MTNPMREALEACESWLNRWAQHVGSCEGGNRCTCGLTAVWHEASAALSAVPAPVSEEEDAAKVLENYFERLQIICERLGCEPGENRLDFLDRFSRLHVAPPVANESAVPQRNPEWRPIETAPRDGTIIELTWMENGKPQEIWPMCWNVFASNSLVQPHKGIWCMRQANGKIQATWSEYNDGGGPTHWREINGSVA